MEIGWDKISTQIWLYSNHDEKMSQNTDQTGSYNFLYRFSLPSSLQAIIFFLYKKFTRQNLFNKLFLHDKTLNVNNVGL